MWGSRKPEIYKRVDLKARTQHRLYAAKHSNRGANKIKRKSKVLCFGVSDLDIDVGNLTAKAERFCQAFARSLNWQGAALEAGYASIGPHLFTLGVNRRCRQLLLGAEPSFIPDPSALEICATRETLVLGDVEVWCLRRKGLPDLRFWLQREKTRDFEGKVGI